MLILTKDTLHNADILKTKTLPRKFMRRVTVLPRGAGPGVWTRIAFENQFLRYLMALTPFVAIMLMWEGAALPVAHAPLPMVAFIFLVEMRLLRLSDAKRRALVTPDEAARRLDLLAFRARAILRGIAARHGLDAGGLHLVVEQSELARIAPLTLVTVQAEAPSPRVLALSQRDREEIRTMLFDADLTERALHEVNMAQGVYLRDVRLEARSVSAHARLAAFLETAPRGQAVEA